MDFGKLWFRLKALEMTIPMVYHTFIKCAQANLYTYREQRPFIKVYRFACAHFIMNEKGLFKAKMDQKQMICGEKVCSTYELMHL